MRLVLLLTALSALIISGICTGCGGGGNSIIAVLPNSITVDVEGTAQFTAMVNGLSNREVSWDVVEVSGGTVSDTGLYQAPATTGIYHVTVTCVAEPTLLATATIIVEEPQFPIEVAVSPESITLYTEGTEQFNAMVTGTDDTDVIWSVDEVNGGTIAVDGTYTAPAIAGIYHVTATSTADDTKADTATVTVLPTPIDVDVSISPPTVLLYTGDTLQFTATVTGAAVNTVNWTTDGGVIDADGVYTAPAIAGVYHVTAASTEDPTKTATAEVTVSVLSVLSIAIGPHTVHLAPNEQRQFHYSISNASDTSVSWQVDQVGGGSITPAGIYTAPAATGNYTITVISSEDPTKTDTANIYVR